MSDHRRHGVLKHQNADGSHHYINLCECHKMDRPVIAPNATSLVPEVQGLLDTMHDRIEGHRAATAKETEELRGHNANREKEISESNSKVVALREDMDKNLLSIIADLEALGVSLRDRLEVGFENSKRRNDDLEIKIGTALDDILNLEDANKDVYSKLADLKKSIEVLVLAVDARIKKQETYVLVLDKAVNDKLVVLSNRIKTLENSGFIAWFKRCLKGS